MVIAYAIATMGLGCSGLDSQSSIAAEDSVHAESALINPQGQCERDSEEKHCVFKDQEGNVEELELIKSNCLTPEQIAELKQFHLLGAVVKGCDNILLQIDLIKKCARTRSDVRTLSIHFTQEYKHEHARL